MKEYRIIEDYLIKQINLKGACRGQLLFEFSALMTVIVNPTTISNGEENL